MLQLFVLFIVIVKWPGDMCHSSIVKTIYWECYNCLTYISPPLTLGPSALSTFLLFVPQEIAKYIWNVSIVWPKYLLLLPCSSAFSTFLIFVPQETVIVIAIVIGIFIVILRPRSSGNYYSYCYCYCYCYCYEYPCMRIV